MTVLPEISDIQIIAGGAQWTKCSIWRAIHFNSTLKAPRNVKFGMCQENEISYSVVKNVGGKYRGVALIVACLSKFNINQGSCLRLFFLYIIFIILTIFLKKTQTFQKVLTKDSTKTKINNIKYPVNC